MDERRGGTAKAFRRPWTKSLGASCLILSAALLSACADDVQLLAISQSQRCALPPRYVATLRAMSPKQRQAHEPLTPLQPSYPDKAAFKQAEGCALVRFTVAADGSAQHVTVISEYPPDSGFGEALARAVSEAKYRGPDHKPRYQHTDFLLAGGLGR